jgi:hypothetical protein
LLAGRDQSIGAALLIERDYLLPMAAEGMDLAQASFPAVNNLGCVPVIELALSTGCHDAAAVNHLLNADELRHVRCDVMDVGALERYARPLPVMNEYDQLLTAGVHP